LPNSKILTTVIVVLIAALVISSTVAGYYLLQYQQAQNNANLYLSELKTATTTTTSIQTTTVVTGGQTKTITSTVTGTAGFSATTNILLNFENGTRTWYNNTAVQPGWNLYLATVLITRGDMNATYYPQYQEHLVTGLDGVQNSANESWFIWTWNSTASWQVAQVGADQIPTPTGSVFAWTFCGTNSDYAPTCSEP
jgi:hypothetical protein